ncbi:MAG TPA: O-antigen ligase family protein [Armatimonadota bacterium]|nr:O-antigen ligase family protein [Armatimonadota bacterium]
MKKKQEQERTFSLEAPAAALVIVVLVIAPFVAGKEHLTTVAAVSILAIAAAGLLIWSKQFTRPVAFWPFAAFIALLAASTAITASMHATLEQTFYFAACAAAALVASSAFKGRNKWFSSALLGFAAVGLILGAMGVAEYVQNYKSSGVHGWRVFASFITPGYFGGFLVLALPVTLAAFLASRSFAAVMISALALGFEMASLFLTGTRFALISVIGAFIVFAILLIWTRKISKMQLGRLGIAVLILVVAGILASAPMWMRVQGSGAAQQSYSGGFRVATWKGTINVIRANPLLGTGAGTFDLVFPKYMVAGYTRNAHNGYLEIAADAGIPALVAASMAFLMLLITGLKRIRSEDEIDDLVLLPNGISLLAIGAAAALFGSLARNLLDSDLQNAGIGFPFWILAGLLASRAAKDRMISLSTGVKVVFSSVFAAIIVVLMLFAIGQARSDAAVAAIEEGDLSSGVALLYSAISVDPLRADHKLLLGRILAQTAGGDDDLWGEGIGYIKEAAELEPTRARNMLALGRAYLLRGDNKEALNAFNKTLELDPHATPAMIAAARILEQDKKTKPEAERMYKRMLDHENTPFELLRGVPELVNPDYVWAHDYIAKKYIAEGNTEAAKKHFQAIIDRLELRESYQLQRLAAEAAGMVDQEQEDTLKALKERAKAELEKLDSAQSEASAR